MSERDEALPRPLQGDGTELEQRLLKAATRERPTRQSTERMARALGIAPPAIVPTTASPTGAETTTSAAAATSGALPWISGALVMAALGGVVALFQPKGPASTAPPSPRAPAVEVANAAPARTTETTAPLATAAETQPPAQAAPRPAASSGDLRDQIALLDSARAAMAASKNERALDLLQRYLAKYPSGSFRPEAKALKIETLSKLGRKAESRALAERFVAEHEGSPLTKRVKDIAEPASR